MVPATDKLIAGSVSSVSGGRVVQARIGCWFIQVHFDGQRRFGKSVVGGLFAPEF